jgi:hypothetical protein
MVSAATDWPSAPDIQDDSWFDHGYVRHVSGKAQVALFFGPWEGPTVPLHLAVATRAWCIQQVHRCTERMVDWAVIIMARCTSSSIHVTSVDMDVPETQGDEHGERSRVFRRVVRVHMNVADGGCRAINV